MSNPHKGEVGVKIDGTELTLSFSADAFSEMEIALDKSMGEIIDLFQNPEKIRLQDLRVMFWKGLGDHHPDITFEAARDILKKIKPTAMATMVAKAFVQSMPDNEEGEGGKADPQKPDGQSGTGPAS